ncbi:MAG TPA: hypothetical protein VN899_03425 [Stellaceae bacterium]|nr:hypothetical protein [Stellaceae bacterium]
MSDTGIIDHDPERIARKKRRRFAVMSWLASALVLVLALVATSPYWAPSLSSVLPWGMPGGAGNPALGGRLDAIEQKLSQLANQPNEAGATPDLTAVQSKLQDQAAAQDKLDQRLGALEARVANLSDDPQRLLLISLGQLSAAIETSRPYAGELGSAEALASKRPDILAQLKTLDAASSVGIPGAAVLARQFSQDVAPAMLRAGADSNAAADSWWQRVLARLRSLVVIRRTDADGQQSADPVVAAVSTAEAALDQGDVAGAVSTIEALPADTRTPAQPWLVLAHKRLDAEATVAQAIEATSQALAAPGAKTP